MIKKIKKIILIFILYFMFSTNVFADICSGLEVKNSTDGTCGELSKSYHFLPFGGSYSNCNTGECYSVFEVPATNSYSGETEYAMCLDPKLSSPYYKNNGNKIPYDYKYVRAIDPTKNSEGDGEFYRIYQQYVNELGANYSYQNRINNLKLSDIYARKVMKDNGWTINGTNFRDEYLNENSNALNFYTAAKNMNLWENPLSFTSSVDFDSEKSVYTFKIDVDFTNDTSQYFYNTTTNLINGDYNIGYGDAFFKYELQINNGTYDLNNAISHSEDVSGELNKWNYSSNSKKTFELKMSKEIYDAIVAQSGKTFINLKFSTYNAMSYTNVIVAKRHPANTSNQRMLVFTKFIENGNFSTGDGLQTTDVNFGICKQEGDKFYYNGQRIELEEYKNKCDCTNIDSSKLNQTAKDKYFEICPLKKNNETYDSTLNKCDTKENVNSTYSGTGQNKLLHNINQSLNNNSYCTLTCDEEIVTNGFVDKYSVLAGTKFELSTLPMLTANKICKVKVDYSSWKESYEILIKDEAAALTKLDFDNAVRNARSTRETCYCNLNGCTYATRYDYSYNEYYYNGNSIFSTSKSDYYGGCGSKSKPNTNSYSTNVNILSLKKSNLEKHFEKLKTCSSYLSNQGTTNQEYYKFKVGLSYYYQQEYIKSGLVWNNRKPNGETDDSPMNSKLDSETSNGNYANYKNNNICYTYIKDSSNINATYCAGTTPSLYSVDIYRNTEYKYSFKPSVNKYTDILSGKISSIASNLNNPVLIGNVYDTDITAKTKENNSNYYEFTSIGENDNIYKYFNEINKEKLKRYCNYEIASEITKGDKFNLVYRVVDPNNIDPNNRKRDNKGLKNWTQEQIDAANNEDTFNPDNLEYSFTLDSKTIKEIREYNKNKKYSDITFDCTNGLQCKSKFIESASSGSSDFSTKFATNVNGSTKWKNLE